MSLLDTALVEAQIPDFVTDSTGAWPRKASVRWTAAALVLLAGYADLLRGGETVAPILLVIGYGVLVPLAILGVSARAGE
jgi:hypothetical protein